jgi:hypothetical protein
MKIKTLPATKFALLCTALVGALLTFSDSASALTIRDAHELGSTYVNHLVGMALSSDEIANGQYFRSSNSMPQAVLTDQINGLNAGGQSAIITAPGPGGGGGPGPAGVPDGGITAMLLGAALGALGMARRYLMS